MNAPREAASVASPATSPATSPMGTSPAAPSPTARGSRRRAVLDAAARLFNRRGLRGATLAEVAADVGLATNSITYYFRRKEDLAVACLLEAIDAVVTIADGASGRPTPRQRAQAFLDGYLRLLADIDAGRRAELVRFHDIRALEPAHRSQVVAAYVPMFRRVRSLLGEPGASARSRRALSARTLLLLTMAFWARVWIRRYAIDDYPLVASRIGDILMGGLAGSGADWAPPRWTGVSPLSDPSEEAMPAAFLKAATLLLNEQGYRGASIDRISARINLTKGAFYHHHADKDELIRACFERSFATIRRAQDLAARRGSGCGCGWERLLNVAGNLTCHQLSDSGPLLRFTARSALPEAMRGEARRTMDRLTQRYGHIVVDGIADGSLRPVDPAIAADMITGTINAVVELGHWLPGFDVDEALDLFLRPLMLGLGSDTLAG